MSAETVPFFCADCESELTGEAHRQPDGRYICGTCKEKLRQKAESKKQGGLFEEQKSLFNPKTPKARRGNVEGFRDANGVFHPIRASKDYNEFLAGDFEPTKRELSKRGREQKEWERKELRAVAGASGLPKRSLASFVRSIGGMTPGGMYAGEVKRLSSTQTGTTGLINKKARQGSQKQTPEYVMDAANEEGYRDKQGRKFENIGDFLLAVEDSAIKGVSKTRRRGPTRKQRDVKILAKAMASPKRNNPYIDQAITIFSRLPSGALFRLRNKKTILTKMGFYGKAVSAKGKVYQIKDDQAVVQVSYKNPGMFGSEAVTKAKRVTKIRRVRHRDTGQLGEITGSAPSGWVKVKWDNRDKATLIKRSEIALARGRQNPARYTVKKTYFRNDPKFGRTTTLLKDGKPVLVLMGVVSKKVIIAQYENRVWPLRKVAKENPLNAQIATVRTRDGKIKSVATSAGETDRQLLARAKATHVIKRVVTGSHGVRNPKSTAKLSAQRVELYQRVTDMQNRSNALRRAGKGAEADRLFTKAQALLMRVVRSGDRSEGPIGRLPNPKREAKTSKDAFGVTHENPKRYSRTKEHRQYRRAEYNQLKSLPALSNEQRARFQWLKEQVVKDNKYALDEARKKNPSVAAIAEKFQGKIDGAVEEFHAASSAPANLARAGKLVFLKAGKTFRLPGAMVAIAPNEKLWIVGKRAPMFETKAKPGERLDVGELTEICYETAKQHIGNGKTFEYHHVFGEDGGKCPHLHIDHEGMPLIVGGDYKIRAEGIVN